MRIYELSDNWHHEIQRDVLKRGKWVHPGRMQDKNTENDDGFNTKEVINYSFCILNVGVQLHQLHDAMKIDSLWADAEFFERIAPEHINPGKAWMHRAEVWQEFLERNKGRFAYSYNERIRTQLQNVIDELNKHKYTRQAIVSIYSPEKDSDKIGIDRIPCSIYYQFLFRDDKLHVIYNMRSCDVFTHYHNDIYLAIRLLKYVANECGFEIGNFYMNIGSLHAYKKDIPKKMLEDMY